MSFAADVRALLDSVPEHQEAWDRLDAGAGDGDFGTTVARGAGAAVRAWADLAPLSPAELLAALADLLAREMGGTSGPLFAAALRRAATAADGEGFRPSVVEGVAMLEAATVAVRELGAAAIGDKTMLDALVPAADAGREALAAGGDAAAVARDVAQAAFEGALATAGMRARRGRAARAGERSTGSVDPGAAAVAVFAGQFSKRCAGSAPDLSMLTAVSAPADGASPASAESDGAMKAFVDDPADFPAQSLSGLAAAHPDLVVWDPIRRIVRRRHGSTPGRVGLVSGGGSGHEPLHAGFVGDGMLTSAAPGPVFASPSADAVLEAVKAADGGAGVLAVVKNYTGDVLNFAQAAERAAEAGIEVARVLVDDDVAVDGSEFTVGRRGTGATLFVEKIAGAAAEDGRTLYEVRRIAERVVARSASFGVALRPCTPPGGRPLFDLGPGEIELGIGIHGERGRERAPMSSASELLRGVATTLIEGIAPPDGGLLVLVSGLGATPLAEQYLAFGILSAAFEDEGLTVSRSLIGPYVTALNMAGILMTVLALDEDLTALWDAPVRTPGLRWAA